MERGRDQRVLTRMGVNLRLQRPPRGGTLVLGSLRLSQLSTHTDRLNFVSGCFSSAASISLFLCPSASAGVASHSILLATTAQHVRGQGLWEGGALLWRVRPPESAGKLEAES